MILVLKNYLIQLQRKFTSYKKVLKWGGCAKLSELIIFILSLNLVKVIIILNSIENWNSDEYNWSDTKKLIYNFKFLSILIIYKQRNILIILFCLFN